MANCYVNDFNTTVKTYYKDIKNCNPLTKEEEKDLMHKAKKNDLFARNKILTSNLKFVFDVAKKYKGYGVPMEDLISEGNMGLMYAFDKFDEKRDVKFFTYAVWWIREYIQQYIKDHIKQTEMTESDDELLKPVTITQGVVDSEDEKVNVNDVIMSNEDDFIKNETTNENKELVKKLLDKLNFRERTIIESYFGIGENKEMNLEEVAKKVGLSAERVRQLKSKSLLKLRSEMLLLS